MNEVPYTLRAETLALDTVIRAAIAEAEASISDGPVDRMVFLGNRHQSFPTSLVKDPVLEPVDKLVWMVIMLSVRETGGNTAFPGYDAIGRMANVSSRSTIARAIAILRATRWLTLCARRKRINGRFRGHVYALHDEPLPLADALYLDANYMAFLNHALDHGHRRVGAVAKGVLDSLDEDSLNGEAVTAQPHPIERRLGSVIECGKSTRRRFFSFNPRSIERLRRDLTVSTRQKNHHDQNSNTVDDQISNLSSSSNINNKTTTTNDLPSKLDIAGDDNEALIYPARLSANHRGIAARYLKELAPAQRQPILDELEGRFNAEKKGMRPVYDEINFLHSLCKLMRRGDFQANLGVTVRDARQRERKSKEIVAQKLLAYPPKETDEQRRDRMTEGRARVAALRNILRPRAVIENQDVTNES